MMTRSLPFFILIWSFLLFRELQAAPSNTASRTFKFSNQVTAVVSSAKEDGADQITFLKNGKKTGCLFAESPGRSFFETVDEVKLEGQKNPLYVSRWTLGAHGEKYNVFDPTRLECSLVEIDWGHPITYEVEGDHLKFVKSGGSTEKWKPEPFKPSALRGSPSSNPSAPNNP